MHHSSEEYNLTTAVRQGSFQRFGSSVIVFFLLMRLYFIAVTVPDFFTLYLSMDVPLYVTIVTQHVAIVVH